MGSINVRKLEALASSTSEKLNTLTKKRKDILNKRKQTSLDIDKNLELVKESIINYIKETHKGNLFVLNVDIFDNETSFKLMLANDKYLESLNSNNILTIKTDISISIINENINYLKSLRKQIDSDLVTTEFDDNTDQEEEPIVNVNIKTRTKYF